MWFRIVSCASFLLFLVACAARPPEPPTVEVPRRSIAEERFHRALSLELQQKEQEALLLYKQVMEEIPSSRLAAKAAFRAAKIYWRRGYAGRALELLNRAVKTAGPQDPLYHESYLLMAEILYREGHRERAQSYLEEVNPALVSPEEYEALKKALAPPPPPGVAPKEYNVVLFVGETKMLEKEWVQVKRGVDLAFEGSGVEVVEVASPSELESLEGPFLGVVGPLLVKNLPPVLDWASREGVPVVTPFPVAPGLTSKSPLLFRTSLPLDQETSFMAGFLRSQLGVKELAIFYPSTPYGKVMSRLMSEEIQAVGGEVTLLRSYPPNVRDFSPYALELKEWEEEDVLPQALYVPDSWRRVVLLVPQLVFHEVKGISLAGTALWDDSRLVREGGGYVEYSVFPDTFTSHSPYLPVLEFYYRFKLAYSVDPTPLAAQAYDAARALLARLEGKDGLIPLEEVSFLGVTGIAGFTPRGEPVRVPFLLVVEGSTIRQMN